MHRTTDRTWKKAVILMAFSAVLIIVCVMIGMSSYRRIHFQNDIKAGRVYMESSDYTKAIQAYKSAIRMNPEDAEAYLSLVELYVRTGKYASAQSYAEQGYSLTGARRLEELTDQLVSLREEGDTTDKELFKWVLDEANPDTSITYNGKNIKAIYLTGLSTDQPGITAASESGEDPETEKSGEMPEETENTGNPAEVVKDKFMLGGAAYSYDSRVIRVYRFSEPLDLTPLADCPHLEETELTYCWVQSLEPLSRCPGLKCIHLQNVYELSRSTILDLTSLADCDLLRELYLAECEVESFEPLSRCRRLTDLSLSMMQIDEPLDFPQLESLSIYNCQFDTLWLSGCSQLTGLRISADEWSSYAAGILDLSSLPYCSRLEDLSINGMQINTLKPLSECSQLRNITLRRCSGFSDLSPLADISSLECLIIDGNKQITTINPIMSLELAILDINDTSVPIEEMIRYYKLHPDCLGIRYNGIFIDDALDEAGLKVNGG